MLSRYTIYRRRPDSAGPLPEGIRQDTRWRTRHLLRPTQDMVESFLADPSTGWKEFQKQYLHLLAERFHAQREEFEALATLATHQDVFLGCNCPTAKNPDVHHCHTWLALEFMQRKFPQLPVTFPSE
ncbi:hypothetical protein SH661x_004583 [Planctomicrobium sp. SH661]|uniref:DUF488 family protein, N3 subclade n=1 Tax=Planctomicrobium sp. SH661 TaxID=3448124 RepID=UPI003F5C5824